MGSGYDRCLFLTTKSMVTRSIRGSFPLHPDAGRSGGPLIVCTAVLDCHVVKVKNHNRGTCGLTHPLVVFHTAISGYMFLCIPLSVYNL